MKCPKCNGKIYPFINKYTGIETGYKWTCENCKEDFYNLEVKK